MFGSVVWACVPILVADAHIGTAYGLMACFQNSAQFVVPLLVQHVLNSNGHNFLACEKLFIVLSLFAFSISMVIYMYDKCYGGNSLKHATDIREARKSDSIIVVENHSTVYVTDHQLLLRDYGSIELT